MAATRKETTPVREQPGYPIAVVAFVIALSALAGIAARSQASCNEPPPSSATSVTLSPQFEGELGGVESPFLLPEKAFAITAPQVDANDTVSIVYLPTDAALPKPAVVVLSKDCGRMPPPACDDTVETICEKNANPSIDAATGIAKFTLNSTQRVGHVRLAITSGHVLPCWLAVRDAVDPCNTTDHPSLHACIVKLKTPPGTDANDIIDTVTALPKSNDFQTICDPDDPSLPDKERQCHGKGTYLSLVLDAHGDALIPMDWSQLLRHKTDHSKPCTVGREPCERRDIVARTTLPTKLGKKDPINLAGAAETLLQSFNQNGKSFGDPGPKFTAVESANESVLEGTIDEPLSVLRIRHCRNATSTCDWTAENVYFDLRERMDEKGLVVIRKNGKKDGYCDSNGHSTKACKDHAECKQGATEFACVRVGGEALDSASQPQPPPTTTLPGSPSQPSGDGSVAVWLVALVLLGVVVWVLVKRS